MVNGKHIFRGLILIILSAFFLGAYTLEFYQIKYVSEGGSALFKIHPASYVALITVFYFYTRIKNNDIPNLLGPIFRPWMFLLIAIVWVIFYELFRTGISGLAFIIDTLLMPILIFPVAVLMDHRRKVLIFKIMASLVMFNSITAIITVINGVNIWPYPYEESYFRSTAWLSHPLNNALVMASLAPLLFSQKSVNPILIFVFVLIALFAFGARMATGVYVLIGGLGLLISLRSRYVSNGGFYFYEILYLAIFLMISPFVLYLLIYHYDLGARIFENIKIDASGQARLDVFFIFGYLSFSEIIWGVSPEVFDNMNLFINNSIVENYFLAWILKFGLVGALPLAISFFYFLLKIAIFSNSFVRLSILIFILVSLSNNALASKTQVLFFLLILIAFSFEKKSNRPV